MGIADTEALTSAWEDYCDQPRSYALRADWAAVYDFVAGEGDDVAADFVAWYAAKVARDTEMRMDKLVRKAARAAS